MLFLAPFETQGASFCKHWAIWHAPLSAMTLLVLVAFHPTSPMVPWEGFRIID